MKTVELGRIAALAMLLATVWIANAQALELDASVIGLGDFSSRTTNQDPGYNSKFHLGEGVLLESRIPNWLDGALGVEIGVLHFSRSVGSVSPLDGSETDIGTEHLQLPLLVRYWFLPYVSAGIGAYYTFGLGSVTMVSADSKGYITQDYWDAGLANHDYGLLAAIGANYPITSRVSGLADFRYELGLNNLDITGQDNSKFRDLQILIGARFNFTL